MTLLMFSQSWRNSKLWNIISKEHETTSTHRLTGRPHLLISWFTNTPSYGDIHTKHQSTYKNQLTYRGPFPASTSKSLEFNSAYPMGQQLFPIFSKIQRMRGPIYWTTRRPYFSHLQFPTHFTGGLSKRLPLAPVQSSSSTRTCRSAPIRCPGDVQPWSKSGKMRVGTNLLLDVFFWDVLGKCISSYIYIIIYTHIYWLYMHIYIYNVILHYINIYIYIYIIILSLLLLYMHDLMVRSAKQLPQHLHHHCSTYTPLYTHGSAPLSFSRRCHRNGLLITWHFERSGALCDRCA